MEKLSQKFRWRFNITKRYTIKKWAHFKGNSIPAFWYIGKVNFGDLLTPCFLSSYGYSPYYHEPKGNCLLSAGSILQLASPDFEGVILGSGVIAEDTLPKFKHAKILGVRGKLSQEMLNAPNDTPLGDPGLLCKRLLKTSPKKRYRLGVIPHMEDKKDKRVYNLFKRYPKDILTIDVQKHPSQVMKNIQSCQRVLSSSLHGLIIADALDIPNAWLVFSGCDRGKGFKFFDYYSAFNEKREPIVITGNENIQKLEQLTSPPPKGIPEIQQKLHDNFIQLKEYF